MRISKTALFLLISISICLLFPVTASANSVEPPILTVIVINPPDDLSLSLLFSDDTNTEPIILNPEKKAWETYYRFFHPGGQESAEGATLVVNYSNESFQCELPWDSFNTYNNIVTLDIAKQATISGQPVWRIPILVAMRVFLTLLIEGLIFSLFGFRNKKSWITFFIINLITQGTLNALLTGPVIGSYWLFGFIAIEAIVFVAEMILFACVLTEYSKRRAVFYAFTANAASLVLGGALILYLPI